MDIERYVRYLRLLILLADSPRVWIIQLGKLSLHLL